MRIIQGLALALVMTACAAPIEPVPTIPHPIPAPDPDRTIPDTLPDPLPPEEQGNPDLSAKYPEPPRNDFADISFEAATLLFFLQPNCPMGALDCVENPIRQGWNDWCDLPPAPADKIIDPTQYTDEELLEILQEDFY